MIYFSAERYQRYLETLIELFSAPTCAFQLTGKPTSSKTAAFSAKPPLARLDQEVQ